MAYLYANSTKPHQTAPEGAVTTVYTVFHSHKYLKKQQSKIRPKKYGIKGFKILGHLPCTAWCYVTDARK